MNLPPYETFPELEDDMILLREIDLKDIDSILSICVYNSVPPDSIEKAKENLDKIRADYESGNTVHWGIMHKESGKLTGTCGYYRGFKNNTGEIGFILLPEQRGKGLMSRSVKLAIDFGFEEMKLLKIIAITSKDNSKAMSVLERNNFHQINKDDDAKIIYEKLKP